MQKDQLQRRMQKLIEMANVNDEMRNSWSLWLMNYDYDYDDDYGDDYYHYYYNDSDDYDWWRLAMIMVIITMMMT